MCSDPGHSGGLSRQSPAVFPKDHHKCVVHCSPLKQAVSSGQASWKMNAFEMTIGRTVVLEQKKIVILSNKLVLPGS